VLVAAVLATHPWLAAGTLTGKIQIRDDRPAPVKAGVPWEQWPLIQTAADQSTCSVSPLDLAAMADLKRNFGQSVDAWVVIARTLCARGYGVDRVRALNSFGSGTDYAAAVTALAATLVPPEDVVHVAEQWLGVPYVFGGCSRNGVDCSCLVELVFQKVGISLPRTAAEQHSATTRVTREQLLPGDLVFFANTYMPGISHVGIYIGGGQQINAPTERQSVSIQPVFEGYWGAHFAGGGRVKR
jgi:cell wall-associated NlpC family hydrolase